MKVVRKISDCRAEIASFRQNGDRIGLVPTMGFLHEGHLSLVKKSQENSDRTVVTIFVNPTQFGDAADLDAYPRDEDRDLELLRKAGVDLVLIPSVQEVYPEGDETIVETTRMANMLHGLVRPGHFRGVTTVVARLFNFVGPDIACFGEKDYQQLQVIKRMVTDLAFPIEIIGVPTMREPDGLAMSSRNVRLTAKDRKAAVVISQALDAAQKIKNPTEASLRNEIENIIQTEPRGELVGLDIVDATSLAHIKPKPDAPIAIMMSVKFGEILLIDQRVIRHV